MNAPRLEPRATEPVASAAASQGDVSRRTCLEPIAYDIVCTSRGEVRVAAPGTAALLTSSTYVDDLPIAASFGDIVPPDCADLVDVAVAVYVADRLCRRHPRSVLTSERLWQRRMRLQVPVRNPHRWQHDGLGDALAELLAYLTDDVWSFTFVQRETLAARASEAQRGLFPEPPPPPASAALFSGGLDSLAGLVSTLSARPTESVVVFCGRTNKRIGVPQRKLLKALDNAFPQRVRPIAVRFGFRGRVRRAFDNEETSQRTRGFVFQAFGAVTARMAGLDRLDVYENGVGAINLPYTDAQLGSQATRATHPVTLRLVSALLTKVFAMPFTVVLPFAFMTKGELCDALRAADLGHLARYSVSCDGYPQRRKRAEQCGVCLSCVLRRQSLHHADLHDHDAATEYLHDVYKAHCEADRERGFAFRAMSCQVHHLRRALDSTHPWESLAARYPEVEDVADALSSITDRDSIRHALIDLYGRYVAEWAGFASSAPSSEAASTSGAVLNRPSPPRAAIPSSKVISPLRMNTTALFDRAHQGDQNVR